MVHPLVDQLRFTRGEWRRALAGVTEEEGARRFPPINSIGWMVGHLAAQEHRYWLERAQGRVVLPELYPAVGYGAAPSTPSLAAMWAAWEATVAAVDPYLDGLTTARLQEFMVIDGRAHDESVGSMLRRVTYHYWYHLGEAQAVRQLLGHTALPEFVGDIQIHGPYRPE